MSTFAYLVDTSAIYPHSIRADGKLVSLDAPTPLPRHLVDLKMFVSKNYIFVLSSSSVQVGDGTIDVFKIERDGTLTLKVENYLVPNVAINSTAAVTNLPGQDSIFIFITDGTRGGSEGLAITSYKFDPQSGTIESIKAMYPPHRPTFYDAMLIDQERKLLYLGATNKIDNWTGLMSLIINDDGTLLFRDDTESLGISVLALNPIGNFLYVGTEGHRGGTGLIAGYRLSQGMFSPAGNLSREFDTSVGATTVSADGNYLFSIGVNQDFKGDIFSFSIDPKDKTLTELNEQPSPVSLTLEQAYDGKYVYAVNGGAYSYQVDRDGMLTPLEVIDIDYVQMVVVDLP